MKQMWTHLTERIDDGQYEPASRLAADPRCRPA